MRIARGPVLWQSLAHQGLSRSLSAMSDRLRPAPGCVSDTSLRAAAPYSAPLAVPPAARRWSTPPAPQMVQDLHSWLSLSFRVVDRTIHGTVRKRNIPC